MSRYCGEMNVAPILEAAEHWRSAALLGQGSVFTAGSLWSSAQLAELDQYFVQRPDAGSGKFLEKLQQQLEPATAPAKQLMAEMMWLMYLCPSSLTPGHKRQTVQTIWSWSKEPFPGDSGWLTEERLRGIGSAGPGFNQNQWRELVFLITLIRRFHQLGRTEQEALLANGWAFDDWLASTADSENRQLRHMVLFLLFPDSFERIFGKNDRKAVTRKFSQREPREINRMTATQLDRELYAIRQRLESEHGTHQLDYYVSPLKEAWRSERITDVAEVLKAEHVNLALDEIDRDGIPSEAASFRYDLVHDGKSYPPKLVLSLAVKYATGELLDRNTFTGGEESQSFKLLRSLGYRIEAKAAARESIAPTISQFLAQAQEGLRLSVQDYPSEYAGLKVRVSFGQGVFARIPWIAFLGPGQSVSQGIYPVILLFRQERKVLLCYGISETNPPVDSWGDLSEKTTVRQWFLENLGHLPDRYGASIVRSAYDVTDLTSSDDLQDQLDQAVEIYKEVLATAVKAGTPVGAPSSQSVVLPVRQDLREAALAFSTALRDSGVNFGARHEAVATTFLASLVTKPLVILTGQSGSGKTQIAIRFGEWLGPKRLHVAAVRPDWTGAEALFGYEDGLKASVDGYPAWSVPAPLEFMLVAAEDSQHPYLLVLDEMNLAHVERYFADVLSGMESRQPCLPNLKRGSDGSWRRRPDGPAYIPFPRNLWIVGTVNVDETTYMFSPKVLDRSNTFEFRVETADLALGNRRPESCIPGDQALIRGLLEISLSEGDAGKLGTVPASELSSQLTLLHSVLSRYNLEFGYRAYYEAMRFAIFASEAGFTDPTEILDRIVVQKILPRLHGARRRLELPLLALAHFCRDLPEVIEESEDLSAIAADATTPGGAKLPVSHAKIARMLRSLRVNQFASFTE